MKRLYIFESHPVQYHAPVYRALHQGVNRAGGSEVHVFYATDAPVRGHFDPGFRRQVTWDEPLLEGYPVTVLGNERGIPLCGFRSLSGKGVMDILRRGRPSAILLTGLAYEYDWAAYAAACLLGIPIWIRTETQDRAFVRPRWKTGLRWIAYSLAYLPVRRALVIGRLNAEHYRRHGGAPERQIRSPYCVVDRFSCLSEAQRREIRNELRARLEIPAHATVLLFCGKLQPKKNPLILLEAIGAMSPMEREGYALLFVGTGEQETLLRQRAAQLPGARVVFAGFQNQTEIAQWYLAADILVLPSRQMGETWGLVVNEALMAGCRAVVSSHVGSHADFAALRSVQIFDGEVHGLLQCLRGPSERVSVEQQRAFMDGYSVAAASEGIAQALGTPFRSDRSRDGGSQQEHETLTHFHPTSSPRTTTSSAN